MSAIAGWLIAKVLPSVARLQEENRALRIELAVATALIGFEEPIPAHLQG